MNNGTGITPLEYKVIIKPDDVENKTAGGIILTAQSKDEQQLAATRATIVAISPLAFSYADWPEGYALPKVGERVVTGPYVGVLTEGKDGEKYRIVNDKDIIGVER